ncbi:MAG: thermonuclease family protein [Sphingomonadales bacterium]
MRLVGIQAPKLPLDRPDDDVWPLGDEAKSFLSELAAGQRVKLLYGGRKKDRHSHVLAHLELKNGLWLQGAMVKSGLAYVYSLPDNRALIEELYEFEDEARNAQRGIWVDEHYQVLKASDIEGQGARFVNEFHIVEGQLISANNVRGRVYLNFGDRWSRDFTVIIERRAARLFDEGWIDNPELLSGQKIQVRGWMRDENGPMIEITHPEQLRIFKAD